MRDRLSVDLDAVGSEIHGQPADLDDRYRVALAAPDDGLDPRDQLPVIERLGKEIVGAEAERLHLGLRFVEARRYEDRGIDLVRAQLAQDLKPVHVGQHQVEYHDVVVVTAGDLDAVLARVGRVADIAFGEQKDTDALRGGGIVFNKQHAHRSYLPKNHPISMSKPYA